MDQDQPDKATQKMELNDVNYTLVKESLCCLICVEFFDNPFTLECGHSYCQICLHQWLNKKKSCPECRLPVSRKPCPSFTLQKLANLFKPLMEPLMEGQETQTSNKDNNVWSKLFPNHNPRGYFRDESDNVARCASCLTELEPDGECPNCDLHYELEAGDVQPIDLDTETDMDHDDEDSVSESDLHFVVSDDNVEYDSDIDEGMSDQYSSDSDDDMPPDLFQPPYSIEDSGDEDHQDDFDGFSNDDQEDMDYFSDDQHNMDHFSDDQPDSDDYDEGVNAISRRLGSHGIHQTKHNVHHIDESSSSSEEDDDDAPDYEGLGEYSGNISQPTTSQTALQVKETKRNRISRDTSSEAGPISDSDDELDNKINHNKRQKTRMVIISDTDEDDMQHVKVPEDPVPSSSISKPVSSNSISNSSNISMTGSSNDSKKEKEKTTEKEIKEKKKKKNKKNKANKNKAKDNDSAPASNTMDKVSVTTDAAKDKPKKTKTKHKHKHKKNKNDTTS